MVHPGFISATSASPSINVSPTNAASVATNHANAHPEINFLVYLSNISPLRALFFIVLVLFFMIIKRCYN